MRRDFSRHLSNPRHRCRSRDALSTPRHPLQSPAAFRDMAIDCRRGNPLRSPVQRKDRRRHNIGCTCDARGIHDVAKQTVDNIGHLEFVAHGRIVHGVVERFSQTTLRDRQQQHGRTQIEEVVSARVFLLAIIWRMMSKVVTAGAAPVATRLLWLAWNSVKPSPMTGPKPLLRASRAYTSISMERAAALPSCADRSVNAPRSSLTIIFRLTLMRLPYVSAWMVSLVPSGMGLFLNSASSAILSSRPKVPL